MTHSPRDPTAARPTMGFVAGLVGALLVSGCAMEGSRSSSDPGAGTSEAGSSEAGMATASASPTAITASPTMPAPGRTIAEEDEPAPATEAPTATLVRDGTATELVLGASCWDGLCVDGMPADQRDDVPRVTVAVGTEVVLALSVVPDQVTVQPFDEDVVALGPVRSTDQGAEVDWEVPGPGTWTVVATAAGADASWFVDVRAPMEPASGAADEFGVAFPGPDWTRPDGSPSDTRTAVNLIAGAEHCDWGRVSFLHVPWPPDGEVVDTDVRDADDVRQYAWDPVGQLEELGITRDREVEQAPPDATPTGFRTAHQELWLGDDADEFAYLVADDGMVRRLERPVVRPAGVLACG